MRFPEGLFTLSIVSACSGQVYNPKESQLNGVSSCGMNVDLDIESTTGSSW